MPELRTPRLLLRHWQETDLPAFAAMNADPEVRRWFPGTQTRDESDATARHLERHFASHGFGFWAVEVNDGAAFVGFVGLQHVNFEAPFAPAVEIGWRLARAHWGKGYAAEAARAALAYAFGPLGLREIVSFAVAGNNASRRVMERIGMRRDVDGDFEHPLLEVGHPYRRHVLYRVRREMVQA